MANTFATPSSPRSRPVITLLTDFGQRDPYVGVMKGQILKTCPAAHLIDLTHQIAPQDVRSASFHLEQSIDFFPRGAIHLAVVDPGVGTERRMLAIRSEKAFFVAPDNGLLTRALRRCGGPLDLVALPVPATSSSTFHGRDVMAPVAARLACGEKLASLGLPVESWKALEFPSPSLSPQRIEANVLVVDHFGNVTLDLPRRRGEAHLPYGSRWMLQGRQLTMLRTYGETPTQSSLLLWSSHDMLELACRNGRAGAEWKLRPGDRVELRAVAGSGVEGG
jgi:S-adenosylmethionine hydrolase